MGSVIIPVQENSGSGSGGGGTTIIGNTSIAVTQGSSWLVNVPNGVTAFQGTNPWIVAQGNSLSVFQGGAWTTSVTQGSSWIANIGNTLSVNIPNGVSVLNFPTSQGVTFGSVAIGSIPGGATVFQGTSPWVSSIPSGVSVLNLPSVQAVTGPILIMGPLVNKTYDAVGVTYPTTAIETYLFYTGGVGTTLVSTVVVTYTDSTKNNLSSVARTP